MNTDEETAELDLIRDPLRCGNCGHDTVKLFNICEPGDERKDRYRTDLVAVCAACGAETAIHISSSITFSFAEGSPGILCGGWNR